MPFMIQNQSQMAALVANKQQALNIWIQAPASLNIWSIFTLRMCGWSIPITIPNRSLVAAFDARKKAGPLLLIIGPWGPHTSTYGAYYHCECVDDEHQSPYQTRAQQLSWLPRKIRACKFKFRPPGALSYNFWSHILAHVSFKTCLISVQSSDSVTTAVLELQLCKKFLKKKEMGKKTKHQEHNIYAMFHRHIQSQKSKHYCATWKNTLKLEKIKI